MATGGKLIYGGWLVGDWRRHGNSPIESGAIYVEDGRVYAIGRYKDLRKRYPRVALVGDASYIVAPGFVNAHSHGRGLTTYQMGQPDEPLETRIVEMFGRPEWGVTKGTAGSGNAPTYDPYLDTLYACCKQIASGITTTFHSHQYIHGPAEPYAERTRKVIAAYHDSGMRCALSLGIRDRSTFAFADDADFLITLPSSARKNPDLRSPEFMSFDAYHALLKDLAASHADISFQIGPWNPVFCSDDLLQWISSVSQSEGWRIQTHLMETAYQSRFARKKYGTSWVERLFEIGMLTQRFSGAHCVWFDRNDIEIMGRSGAQVVHNPGSNMRLQSGIAPVRDMLAAQVPVAFGIDSLGMNDEEDMFQDLRLAHLIQATPGTDGQSVPASIMLDMATHAGAAVTGIDGVGTLHVGSRADIVLLSRPEIEGVPTRHPLAGLVLKRAKPAHVRTVIIGGQILIEDGTWKDRDPVELLRELAKSKPAASGPDKATQRLKQVVADYLRHDLG